MTRIRTWVIAATTTQCTNHYTITAEHSQMHRHGCWLQVIIITNHVDIDSRKLVKAEINQLDTPESINVEKSSQW